MKKRALGKTGILVSEIAFGGVEIGLPYGIGVNSEADMLTEKQAIHLLHAAFDSGVNFFDTARMYGKSEDIIGKAFADRREKVILCTKCRPFRGKDGRLPDDEELGRLIETSLRESLMALQTGYVDVFMLHQADLEILENEMIASVFRDLKEKGIARAIGASTYKSDETRKVINSGIWDVVQLPFNLMDQRHHENFALAEAHGVGIVIRSVLLKGLLSNRGNDLHPALADVRKHILLYDRLIGDGIKDLSTLALKFALSCKEVSSVLVGIDKMEYLRQSLAAADGIYMNAHTLNRARSMAYPDPAFLDLPHWERMGWLR
jgi:aryl-alcohol dehydrogenase-like predicted oxidoreductase